MEITLVPSASPESLPAMSSCRRFLLPYHCLPDAQDLLAALSGGTWPQAEQA
jgi:hypothetical protein